MTKWIKMVNKKMQDAYQREQEKLNKEVEEYLKGRKWGMR